MRPRIIGLFLFLSSIFSFQFTALQASANSLTYQCSEQHLVGLMESDGSWSPAYNNVDLGKQYTIRFNKSMTELSGIQGRKTVYRCRKKFPTKAPDLLTCTNELVGTMTFSFSLKNKKFLANFVSPGGWLAESSNMNSGEPLLTDHLIFGQCQ